MRRVTFQDHYSEGAASYASYRPSYPRALAEHLAEAAPTPGMVWEAGCGSGQLSTVLGEFFERVIATDASAAQLARAAPHPRVEYRCARAEASGLPDDCADLAVAAQAAHWFDLERYYAEVRRVARPGALAALVSYGIMRIDPPLDAVITRFHDEVLGPWWQPERRHVVNGYGSIDFPFEEIALPAVEMRADWSCSQVLSYVETWSAVRALERAEGRAMLETFREELEAAWGDAGSWKTVHWPIAIRAGKVFP